jgi:hypothetical protein
VLLCCVEYRNYHESGLGRGVCSSILPLEFYVVKKDKKKILLLLLLFLNKIKKITLLTPNI